MWSSTATTAGSTPVRWCRVVSTLWDSSWWATSRWAENEINNHIYPWDPFLTKFLIVFLCQVDHAKTLHYVGAGVAFPAGLLFVCLQCVLTYRMAETALDFWMAHVRVALSAGVLISLILSILTQLSSWIPRNLFLNCSQERFHENHENPVRLKETFESYESSWVNINRITVHE